MGFDSWNSVCMDQTLPYEIKSICDSGCLMTMYSLVATLELRYNGVLDKITPQESNQLIINNQKNTVPICVV